MTIPETIWQNYNAGREMGGWLAEAGLTRKGEYSIAYEIRIKTNSLFYEFPSRSPSVPSQKFHHRRYPRTRTSGVTGITVTHSD